jgi:hypothetical protein
MRQRLGLASALLGSPKVLILDEPTNGLDPEGVYWLRQYVRSFADHGGSVLVSSHLLAEVGQTVDDVVIIANGRLVTQSSLADLAQRSKAGVRVRTPQAEALRAALSAEGIAARNGGLRCRNGLRDEHRRGRPRGRRSGRRDLRDERRAVSISRRCSSSSRPLKERPDESFDPRGAVEKSTPFACSGGRRLATIAFVPLSVLLAITRPGNQGSPSLDSTEGFRNVIAGASSGGVLMIIIGSS